MATTDVDALKHYKQLNEFNEERKEITRIHLENVNSILETEFDTHNLPAAIVLYLAQVPSGIVGIISLLL